MSLPYTLARPPKRTLADVHWVGGNPLENEVYGWAAWRRTPSSEHDRTCSTEGQCDVSCDYHAVFTLRNPSASPQAVSLDAVSVFEIPEWCGLKRIEVVSAYRDQRVQELVLEVGKELFLDLNAFEVLVFDTVGVV